MCDQSERCEAEPEVGPCRAAFPHWYYDRKTGSCQSFVYGGCRGNQNNYASEELCKASCAGVYLCPLRHVCVCDTCVYLCDTADVSSVQTSLFFPPRKAISRLQVTQELLLLLLLLRLLSLTVVCVFPQTACPLPTRVPAVLPFPSSTTTPRLTPANCLHMEVAWAT